MKHRKMMVGLALTVATAAAWAQTPTHAPATTPPAEVKADPLAGYITPAEWLNRQPKPKFKEGHTLPMLTRYGWGLGFETQKELADNWHYCVQLEPYTSMRWVERYLKADPKDDVAALPVKLIALVKSNPQKYKLCVGASRELPPFNKQPPEAFARDAEGHLLTDQAQSQDGTVWTPGMSAVLSPAGPESFWEESARLQAEPLKRLNEAVPITIILHGAEYGIINSGWGQKTYLKDPAIVKAKEAWAAKRDVRPSRQWAVFVGERIGRSQQIVAAAIRQAVPGAEYFYYGAGGAGNREMYDWWEDWGPRYEVMRGIGTLPSTQMYYGDFNDGWIANPQSNIPADALTQHLNGRGQEIAGGEPLHYGWLCGGYKELKVGASVSDIPRYMGYLRCAFTAGMIGGNAGYYNFPDWNKPAAKPEDPNSGYNWALRGFDAKFPPNEPPNWLEQMVALARVQAQFSYLEHYLRQGDLLPGPYLQCWSRYSGQPAYELVPKEYQPDPAKGENVPVFSPDDKALDGWEKPGFDDSVWKIAKMPAPWREFPGFAGLTYDTNKFTGGCSVVHRRTITIPEALAGRDLVLNMCRTDYDKTFWNGEQIGSVGGFDSPRRYTIPGAKVKAGPATLAVYMSRGFDLNGGSGAKPGEFTLTAADGSNPIALTGEWKWHVLNRATLYKALAPVGRPVRVLARKLREQPQWLITAWAADGQERDVSVTVPDLGEVTLKATAEANVYEAALKNGKPVVKPAAGGAGT